jgi:hypothetical protein
MVYSSFFGKYLGNFRPLVNTYVISYTPTPCKHIAVQRLVKVMANGDKKSASREIYPLFETIFEKMTRHYWLYSLVFFFFFFFSVGLTSTTVPLSTPNNLNAAVRLFAYRPIG